MIHYKSGFKHQLTEDHWFNLPNHKHIEFISPFIRVKHGIVTVRKGYAWDGASGIPDLPVFMEPSLRHDVKYQLIRLGVLPPSFRKQADREWALDCVASGAFKLTGWITRTALKYVGSPAASPASERWEKIAGPTTHYEYPTNE
jgi:hypothetical protein